MMKPIIMIISMLFFLGTITACNSNPSEPQGDPFLVNMAKNSQQAKQAEAAVNDATAKAKAKTDEALKQVEDTNKGE